MTENDTNMQIDGLKQLALDGIIAEVVNDLIQFTNAKPDQARPSRAKVNLQ